jgi:hypothetical protein
MRLSDFDEGKWVDKRKQKKKQLTVTDKQTPRQKILTSIKRNRCTQGQSSSGVKYDYDALKRQER